MTAATVYRIVVPGVPDPELSPNARVHRMVKARKVRQWRETAGWAARAAAPREPLAGPVRVSATICWPKGRKRHDADNAVSLCKPLFDGMTGIIWVDDRQIVELSVRLDRLIEAGREYRAMLASQCGAYVGVTMDCTSVVTEDDVRYEWEAGG